MPFSNVPDVVRARMACIRKTDTQPELLVRRIVTTLNFRYRLHARNLPGVLKPEQKRTASPP